MSNKPSKSSSSKDEIARLKKHPRKPNIKPSSLGKKKKSKLKKSKSKRPGSKKRNKTAELQIHETVPIPLENIPQGAEFKGYKPFVVQGLKIKGLSGIPNTILINNFIYMKNSSRKSTRARMGPD